MKKVKKLISVSLALAMICLFTACGSGSTNNANDMAGNTGNTGTTTQNGTSTPGGAVNNVVNDIADGVADITDNMTGKADPTGSPAR